MNVPLIRPVPEEDLPRATAKAFEQITDLNDRLHAVERLAMATAAMAAATAVDRVAWCDQLRRLALDPIRLTEAEDGFARMAEHLERGLAKVEAYAVALPGQG